MKAVLDIGGTQTRIGFSEDNQTIVAEERFLTPQSFAEALEKLVIVLRERPLETVLVGVAGVIDRQNGLLFRAPHLPDWNNRPLAEALRQQLQTSVFLENDTALAALGEACQGAGKDKSIVAYISIGTGVGGARVARKKLDSVGQGFEPGHQIIVPEGKEWPYCGQKGCWEAYVSGTAWGEKPVTDDYYQYLALGLVNVTALWSPEIIVIGGGFRDHLILEKTAEQMAKLLPLVKIPLLAKAALGDGAALLGGLFYEKT